MTRRQRRARWTAVGVGVAATLAVVVAERTGRLAWVELRTLDWRFRYANSVPQHPDIVCIDIDDRALELAGRWPWPRHQQAALLAVPAELGAKAVLVDLTWVDAEPLAVEPERDLDIRGDPLDVGADAATLRYGDLELRAAIAAERAVYLGFLYRDRDALRTPEFDGPDGLIARLRQGDERGAAQRAAQLARAPRDLPGGLNVHDLGRVAAAVAAAPESRADEVAARLALPAEAVAAAFEECRQAALRHYVRSRLDMAGPGDTAGADVGAWFAALHAGLTARALEDETPLRAALTSAVREVLGYEATLRARFRTHGELAEVAYPVERIVPTYYLLAEAARRCGFTVFDPDPQDGVTRRLPLLIRHGERIAPQLAFGLACDLRGVAPAEIASSRRPGAQRYIALGDLRIQVDERGRALIPWVAERDWTRQFAHVPAGLLWQVHDRRRMIRENGQAARGLRRAVYGLAEFGEDGAAYADEFERLARLAEVAELARLRGADAEAARHAAALADGEARLDEHAAALREGLRAAVAAAEAAEAAERGELEWLLEQVEAVEALAAQHDAASAALRREVTELLEQLRPLLAGKICLIGYTATALADMKPIPTNASAPGVLAHANLLNAMLQGRTVGWAPAWVNTLLTVVLGLVATACSAGQRPRAALIQTGAAAVIYTALAGALAFYLWTYWLALAAPVAAAALSYVAIATYFYMFVDRERRQLATALGQYTSREIARQVAEDAELCRRAEMREVTTMFTDLRGFTTISERIGAERTQRVLNICLGRMTEVLLRHEALVNKFLGDGVFAFWNPVIYPQADHARRACAAALELLTALEELRAEQQYGAGDPVFAELALRVGVATGQAVVGPCGSEQKYDYTCIGDSVNVAARLESANKFYGTRLLANAATLAAAGDDFVHRPLGRVQVKGKREGVGIGELLGRRGAVPEALLAYAARFAEGVDAFERREFVAAAAVFGACLQERPEDLAAARFAELCARHHTDPPDDDWSGAVELLEK